MRTILLAGGGTGGSVSPLLAVATELKQLEPAVKFLFVGTRNGPERLMSEKANIAFVSIPAGKYRRYFSLKNFLTPILILAGLVKSLLILKKYKPACVFGCGSFVQVPVIWAAWMYNIPIIIHQQDIIPSLANSLCQIVAKKITVAFEISIKDFSSDLGIFYKKKVPDKVILTGLPVRPTLKTVDRKTALKFFNLSEKFPTLLVLGGGSGSTFINNLVFKSLPELSKTVQIIHSVGRDKAGLKPKYNYRPYEFIHRMDMAYSAADFVICRAGMSTIGELSYFKKMAILIPLPKTHQEANAIYLKIQKAALVFPQKAIFPEAVTYTIKKLIYQFEMQKLLSKNIGNIMPHNAATSIAKEIIKLVSVKNDKRYK